MSLKKYNLISHSFEKQSGLNRIKRIQAISNISNCISFKSTVTVKGISVVIYKTLQKRKKIQTQAYENALKWKEKICNLDIYA